MSGSATLLKTVLTRPRGSAITIGSQRGRSAPPTPQAATNSEAKLVNAARARNVERARDDAKRVVDPSGAILLGGTTSVADGIINDLRARGLADSPQGRHMIKMLTQLDQDAALRGKVEAIKAPADKGNPALGMIRGTLGLPPDAEVTDADARRAAVSGLLAELRQQDVGSCFGTSIAIRMHDRKPGQFLDDMKAIMETGGLTRTIAGQAVHVPIPQTMSKGALERPMTLGADGKMTKADGAALGAPVSLAEAPPVVGAMTGIGIAPGERQAKVDQALGRLRKTRAGDAAIAALPATLDANTKAIFAEVLLKRLSRDDLTAEEAVRDAVEAVPGLGGAGRGVVADAAKAETDKTEVEVMPAALVRQLAMDKAGVTEADVRALAAMRAVGAQWRAEMQNDQEGPKFQQLTADYERLQKQLDLTKLAAFERLMVSAEDGYTGEEDNRLLRAWEYSVAQMAEIGQAQYNATKMRKGATDAVKAEMDKIPDFLRDTGVVDPSKKGKVVAKLGEVKDKLKAEFERLYNPRIQARYDADITGEVSPDGSSSRGGTMLVDMTDPTRPWPITDQASFAKIVEGIAMNAFNTLYANETDEATREAARAVAEEMARRAASDRFQTAASDATFDAYRKPGENDTDLKARMGKKKLTPWQVQEGDYSVAVMQSYFEKDTVPTASARPTGTQDAARFVIDTLKGLWPTTRGEIEQDPSATVPVSCGPHAFLLTPGQPSMQAALNSGDDPATYVANKFAADRAIGQAQCATKLTDGIRAAMVEEIVPTAWPNRDAWIRAIAVRLGPDAKVSDVKQAAMDAMPDARFKGILGDRAELCIARAVPPPVAVNAPETLAKVKDLLSDLGVPESSRAAAAARVVARLKAAASGKPAVDAETIERVTLQTLEDEMLKQPEMDSKAIQASLRKGAKPPGLVFADTNWGGGDHNKLFSFAVNPMTGQPELIQMNEDGSEPGKMDAATWVTTDWVIATDPATFGGM